ncbi:transposase [Myxococcus stipitatus]|uniref:transposase n=1 Tax=Myxococcus stipitatus TaxID=83455 RepID=UPI003B83693D
MIWGEFTDGQWERLVCLPPPPRPAMGRPHEDHRLVPDGICWVLRTGVSWGRSLESDSGAGRRSAAASVGGRRLGANPAPVAGLGE